MTKYDLTTHLANLTFIMDTHEKLGTTKNTALVNEFHYCHDDLVRTLEKDHEARKSADERKRLDEDRAGQQGGESGLRGPAGESRREPSGS